MLRSDEWMKYFADKGEEKLPSIFIIGSMFVFNLTLNCQHAFKIELAQPSYFCPFQVLKCIG